LLAAALDGSIKTPLFPADVVDGEEARVIAEAELLRRSDLR
jgi:hypothetical protein